MRPCIHEGHQLISLVVGGHFKNPRALFHADECRCVKRIDIGAHHIFELGVWKLPDQAQLIFGADVFRAVNPRGLHHDQGVAIQKSLSAQRDLVFQDKHQACDQGQQNQKCGQCAFGHLHG